MPEQESDIPSNLLPQALRDLVRILRTSARTFGAAIADGTKTGHVRWDIIVDRPIRFSNEPPWVIVFDPRTRLVARILHQRRDIAAILHRQ